MMTKAQGRRLLEARTLPPIPKMTREEIKERAEKIYAPLKEQLEKEHHGEACVVEVLSGDYFLGEQGIDALKKGRKKHPRGIFHMYRVGHRADARLPFVRWR
jgi:hypothetical protein